MKEHAGNVRIIGGQWRGTRVPVADVAGLRPSADRVRETLFNWLLPRLPGARVLDLFAGSGVLGLEAVSRGAREALLVERDPGLVESLHATVARLKATNEVQVLRADALAWLRAPLHGRFDLVFLDPPFAADLWAEVLESLPPWLAGGAWLYLEAPAHDAARVDALAASTGWLAHRQGRTRDVHYGLYRRADGGAATLSADSHHDDASGE